MNLNGLLSVTGSCRRNEGWFGKWNHTQHSMI